MSDKMNQWYLTGTLVIDSTIDAMPHQEYPEYMQLFGYPNIGNQFISIGSKGAQERIWGLKGSYGILQNWDSDQLFIGLKDEGVNRKDAVIAFGDNPEDSLRFFAFSFENRTPPPPPRELLRITSSGNVGIGVLTPKAKLHVEGGAIMPAAGNGDDAGILFPSDPGGGSDDKAWIRYYARSDGGVSERTALEIGVANDTDPNYRDDILLIPSGGVGIKTNNPSYPLDVNGAVRANRYYGLNSLSLNDYQTVNPASNVYLYSSANDRDSWVFLDSADAGSNWGIYHRQINSPVKQLPANSIGFIGGGNSDLKAYISLADGSAYFKGDISIGGKLALRGSDSWLRLNQEKTFIGVHTPGLFFPGSMNVGGDKDPGYGNASFAGNVVIGAGGNASILVRYINGKHYQNDGFDGLFLNYATGQSVHVGGGQESHLYVHGALITQPISNARAEEILGGEVNGTAIVGAANGTNEPRIDFFFKYQDRIYKAWMIGKPI